MPVVETQVFVCFYLHCLHTEHALLPKIQTTFQPFMLVCAYNIIFGRPTQIIFTILIQKNVTPHPIMLDFRFLLRQFTLPVHLAQTNK